MTELAQKLLKNISDVFASDPELDEYDILPIPAPESNKNPIIWENHKLGIEAWAAKGALMYAYDRLMGSKLQTKGRKITDSSSLAEWSRVVVMMIADCSVAWNVRKELVLQGHVSHKQEYHLTRLVLIRHPKSSETFYHRKWLVSRSWSSSRCRGKLKDERKINDSANNPDYLRESYTDNITDDTSTETTSLSEHKLPAHLDSKSNKTNSQVNLNQHTSNCRSSPQHQLPTERQRNSDRFSNADSEPVLSGDDPCNDYTSQPSSSHGIGIANLQTPSNNCHQLPDTSSSTADCLPDHRRKTHNCYHTSISGSERLMLQREFEVCQIAAEKYANNYHAWTHRVWMLQHGHDLQIAESELEMSDAFLRCHVSDHSAYHYRQYLIRCLGELSNAGTQRERLNTEVQRCTALIQAYPGHEAIWYYRRSLMDQLLAHCQDFPDDLVDCSKVKSSAPKKLKSSAQPVSANVETLVSEEIQFCDDVIEACHGQTDGERQWQAVLAGRHKDAIKRRVDTLSQAAC